ncbi:hypothetical protein [Amycolatopsis sp. La24]|uniref:hypothetical protein n=1 Tax=Amycolatopsis sp. La24 TaxID=3028304 RepID=UPI00056D4250|nr:hypothetical protein [Amycolatopsis sp. La24]
MEAIRIAGELPSGEVATVIYSVHRWACDGSNHQFERKLFTPGAEVFWPKCTSGLRLPQRMAFADELSEELRSDRDLRDDCPTCFCGGPRSPKRAW